MRGDKAFITIAVLVCLLLLPGVALAQAGGYGPTTLYSVRPGAASGGAYRLTGLTWQVEGTAGGGGYRLLAPTAPRLRGNGCCCTWLPCVVRNH